MKRRIDSKTILGQGEYTSKDEACCQRRKLERLSPPVRGKKTKVLHTLAKMFFGINQVGEMGKTTKERNIRNR